MTFVSTLQLVSLLGQLMKFGVKKKHTSGVFTNSDLEPLIRESLRQVCRFYYISTDP